MLQAATLQGGAIPKPLPPQVNNNNKPIVQSLTNEHREEVLAFLELRPVHTAYIAGLIHDRGLVSLHHRGSFHACRNREGQLEGVTLVGHATLLEARSDAALKVFAHLTRQTSAAHVIVGERDKVRRFWEYYSSDGQTPRRVSRQLLLEQRWPLPFEAVPGLRLATVVDLSLVVPAQAAMAFAESGFNPLKKDPIGFRERVAQRITRGLTYVWIEGQQLIFKADVIGETPQVAYLEGIYINSAARGQGFGLRCLTQLGRTLLARVGAISLFVNSENSPARNLYAKAGYELRGTYQSIFLQQVIK